MGKVLIVYCSMTGHTEAAARAVADGARQAGAEVTVKRGREATAQDLTGCGAVAFGSYDAFSYMGGELKDFFDRTFYPTQGQVTDKPCAGFVTHGGGGGAIKSIESLVKSFKLKAVAPSVLVKGAPDDQAKNALRILGAALAAAAKG